jgi:hypothetical protein
VPERTPAPAEPRWWALLAAQSTKPATYRCPFCGKHLPALSEHVLIWPEGDKARRRHAHTGCVRAAREAGRLPSESEWRATQPRPPSLWARLRARLKRSHRG